MKNPLQTFDKRGIPILPGDVLKVFHYISYLRRERRYMYKHVVAYHPCGKVLVVSHLELNTKTYHIRLDGEVHDYYEIVQGYAGVQGGQDYRDRKKAKQERTGEMSDTSCLCCGKVGPRKTWLEEHPNVYVCMSCHDAATERDNLLLDVAALEVRLEAYAGRNTRLLDRNVKVEAELNEARAERDQLRSNVARKERQVDELLIRFSPSCRVELRKWLETIE